MNKQEVITFVVKSLLELSPEELYGLIQELFKDYDFGDDRHQDACNQWGDPSTIAILVAIKKLVE